MPGQKRNLRRAKSVAQYLKKRKVLYGERSDLGLAALQLLLAGRNEFGVISVSSTDCNTSPTFSPNSPAEMTHRIRCWISVLGTPALTL